MKSSGPLSQKNYLCFPSFSLLRQCVKVAHGASCVPLSCNMARPCNLVRLWGILSLVEIHVNSSLIVSKTLCRSAVETKCRLGFILCVFLRGNRLMCSWVLLEIACLRLEMSLIFSQKWSKSSRSSK